MHQVYAFLLLWFFTIIIQVSYSDVIKPALIEITVNTDETIQIEIRTSIEALLSNISTKYNNTNESPNAKQYDQYRLMSSKTLASHFQSFKGQFLHSINLLADGKKVDLTIVKTDIPMPGYTKVPRISTLYLSGKLKRETQSLVWQYPQKFGDNAVRVRQVNTKKQQWHWSEWQWLRKADQSQPFLLTQIFTKKPTTEVIKNYIIIGFSHIIPKGIDHILFIVGLFFFSIYLKPLFWQVTLFTLAHTLTLGLSMQGTISLPSHIVEPLIALSIAYIGIENILLASKNSLHKSRLILTFIFGLLHGLGFASVLQDFGMPDDDFMIALVSFNIGVELGQISILLTAFLTLSFWFRHRDWYHYAVTVPASLIISFWGILWFIERVLG